MLDVVNSTSTISFPAVTTGREAIADVLVRSFGQTYENVYSFYLQRPLGPLPSFECEWLVAMTEKNSRNVRVGCGRYEWEFDVTPPDLARRLVITIIEMQVFPPAIVSEVMSFLSRITYPWSSPAEVKAVGAVYPHLGPIVKRLLQHEGDAQPGSSGAPTAGHWLPASNV